MSTPIGIQLFSVRNAMESDPKGTLKKIKEMGYDGVETCGLAGLTAQEFRDYCDSIDLKVLSQHGGMEFVTDLIDETISNAKILGNKFVVLAYMTENELPGHENHEAYFDKFKNAIKKAKEEGIEILYHNHEYEFSKHEDANLLTYILKDADGLQWEPDVCWVAAGGENPAEYIKTIGVKCPVIHLKDYFFDGEFTINYEKVSRPEGWYPAPIGDGKLDVRAVLESAKEIGSECIIVELDNPVNGMSELECAERSIKWLRNAGY